MSKRQPFLGFNHNVRHAGQLFHVQTEDSGITRLVIFTHCFVDGTILASLRGTYTAEEPDAVVQKRMQEQHKAMLRRVRDGEFDSHPEVLARVGQVGAHNKAAAPASTGTPPAALATPAALPVETTAAAGRSLAKVEATREAKATTTEAKAATTAAAKAESKSEAGALAARLGIKSAPPVAPAGLAGPGLPTANKPDPAAPVVEMDSDSDEDLMIDIVAAEPTEAEEEAFELSKATPLPAARPLFGGDSAEQAPVYPPSPNPLFQVTVGLRSERPIHVTRPVYVRTLHTGRLRMHSTSEGAVMLTPASLKSASPPRHSHPTDSLRKTLFQAQPTIPGAVSAIGLGAPLGDAGIMDDVLLAFLRKEAARPL